MEKLINELKCQRLNIIDGVLKHTKNYNQYEVEKAVDEELKNRIVNINKNYDASASAMQRLNEKLG